jgi:hypothetical protein
MPTWAGNTSGALLLLRPPSATVFQLRPWTWRYPDDLMNLIEISVLQLSATLEPPLTARFGRQAAQGRRALCGE